MEISKQIPPSVAIDVRKRSVRIALVRKLAIGPGAEIILAGTRSATMAVTIDTPPAGVWPWLVQIGYRRARLQNVLTITFIGWAHWIMQTRQFANVKRLAQREALP